MLTISLSSSERRRLLVTVQLWRDTRRTVPIKDPAKAKAYRARLASHRPVELERMMKTTSQWRRCWPRRLCRGHIPGAINLRKISGATTRRCPVLLSQFCHLAHGGCRVCRQAIPHGIGRWMGVEDAASPSKVRSSTIQVSTLKSSSGVAIRMTERNVVGTTQPKPQTTV